MRVTFHLPSKLQDNPQASSTIEYLIACLIIKFKSVTRKWVLFTGCLLLVFLNSSGVLFAMSAEQRHALNSGAYYYDVEYGQCASDSGSSENNAVVSSGSKVYILGDSITVGAEAKYRASFAEKEITPIINASVGRSWTGGGSGRPTTEGSLAPGSKAVETDAQKIKDAGGIIIALGSNGGLSANPIDTVIDTIRSKNSDAPIWWVNTAGTSEWKSANLAYLGPFNQSLSQKSSLKDFEVINWFNEVNPGGDPGTSPTVDKSNLLADGLHPNATGQQKLASLVTKVVISGGGTNTSPSTASGCVCAVGSSVSLVGNDNVEKAFRYFVSKGLTPEQSAGILGNLIAESGVSPTKIQGGGNSNDPHSAGGGGWGLIQWTPGSKIISVAEQAGITTPIYELGTQLEIIWWHLNNISPRGFRDSLEHLKGTTTIEEATESFEYKMEGAGVKRMEERIKFAKEVFNSYGSVVTTSSPVAGGCNLSAGQNTQYINGFTIYYQFDPAWKDKPYSSSTIGRSGCGPTAMAMIITALTGQAVTPVDTANYAASQGLYVPGQGSKWSIGPVLAEHWGLKSEPISKDIGAITAALKAGKLIITPGRGAKPFTSGGHFIVIRAATENGKWLVGDSGHSDTNDKEWDPQHIINGMASGGQYAISK